MPTPPIHERIREAIASELRAIGVELADGSPVEPPWNRAYAMELWEPKQAVLPCLSVTYEGGEEQFRGGTNASDDIGYPVLVAMHGVGPVNTPNDRTGTLPIEFRDRVRGRFHLKHLAGVPEVWQCEFVPNPIINLELPQYEKLTTAVAIIAWARVERAYTGSA